MNEELKCKKCGSDRESVWEGQDITNWYCPTCNRVQAAIAERDAKIVELEEWITKQKIWAEINNKVVDLTAKLAQVEARAAELESNERAYTRIIGEKSYQEVADELAQLTELDV